MAVAALSIVLGGFMLAPASSAAISTGSIAGRVTAGGYTSLAGIEVCALTVGGESVACAETGGEGLEAGGYTIAGLAPNQYKVRFRDPKSEYLTQYYNGKGTWEEADLVQVSPEGLSWGIDAGLESDPPPSTTLTRMPPESIMTSGRSVTVVYEFESSEPGSSECRLDSGSFRSCSSPHSLRASLGPHRFSVRATDLAGHLGFWVSDEFRVFHYEPPRGKGRSCVNFFAQAGAQRYFVKHRNAGARKNAGARNLRGFDSDRDGVACEGRPGPYLGVVTLGFNLSGNFFYGRVSLPARGREVHCLRERPWVIVRKVRGGEDPKISERPAGEVMDRKGRPIPGRFEWKSKAGQASGRFYASVLFYEGPGRECLPLGSAAVSVARR